MEIYHIDFNNIRVVTCHKSLTGNFITVRFNLRTEEAYNNFCSLKNDFKLYIKWTEKDLMGTNGYHLKYIGKYEIDPAVASDPVLTKVSELFLWCDFSHEMSWRLSPKESEKWKGCENRFKSIEQDIVNFSVLTSQGQVITDIELWKPIR